MRIGRCGEIPMEQPRNSRRRRIEQEEKSREREKERESAKMRVAKEIHPMAGPKSGNKRVRRRQASNKKQGATRIL